MKSTEVQTSLPHSPPTTEQVLSRGKFQNSCKYQVLGSFEGNQDVCRLCAQNNLVPFLPQSSGFIENGSIRFRQKTAFTILERL